MGYSVEEDVFYYTKGDQFGDSSSAVHSLYYGASEDTPASDVVVFYHSDPDTGYVYPTVPDYEYENLVNADSVGQAVRDFQVRVGTSYTTITRGDLKFDTRGVVLATETDLEELYALGAEPESEYEDSGVDMPGTQFTVHFRVDDTLTINAVDYEDALAVFREVLEGTNYNIVSITQEV